MKIKLIAIDMDGTLLHSDGSLSEKTKNTLKKAIDKGIFVVPASGRVRLGLPDAVTAIPGIKYALTSNGAAVYQLDKEKPIYQRLMSQQDALQLYDFLSRHDLIIEAYCGGKGYIQRSDYNSLERFPLAEWYKENCRKKKFPVENLRDTIEKAIDGVEKFNIPWISLELRAELIALTEKMGTIATTQSLEANIELNCAGAHKGNGLRKLCEILQVPMEQVMAVGDNRNDLEMLEEAGLSIAMGNAEEKIKQIADFVTKTNNEDGVAYAIEQWVD